MGYDKGLWRCVVFSYTSGFRSGEIAVHFGGQFHGVARIELSSYYGRADEI
jgi:hypothetical protein